MRIDLNNSMGFSEQLFHSGFSRGTEAVECPCSYERDLLGWPTCPEAELFYSGRLQPGEVGKLMAVLQDAVSLSSRGMIDVALSKAEGPMSLESCLCEESGV